MLKLKDIREDRDLKQSDVANFLNISQAAYSRYENGSRKLDQDTLNKLADFFDVSVDYLLGRTKLISPIKKLEKMTPFGYTQSKVEEMIGDDKEALNTLNEVMSRKENVILFNKMKDMTTKDIKKVLKIIQAIEEEEE